MILSEYIEILWNFMDGGRPKSSCVTGYNTCYVATLAYLLAISNKSSTFSLSIRLMHRIAALRSLTNSLDTSLLPKFIKPTLRHTRVSSQNPTPALPNTVLYHNHYRRYRSSLPQGYFCVERMYTFPFPKRFSELIFQQRPSTGSPYQTRILRPT